MLITKHFVFVHLQKAGGNFVKAVCEQNLPPDWLVPNDLDDHTSFQRLPAEHSHLPVFSLIRNPWDWHDYRAGGRGGVRGNLGHARPAAALDAGDARARLGPLHALVLAARRSRGRGGKSGGGARRDTSRGLHRIPGASRGAGRRHVPDAVRAMPATNTSDRGQYREYYDDRLRDSSPTRRG